MASRPSQLFRRASLPLAVLLVLIALVYIPSASVNATNFTPGCNAGTLANNVTTAGSNGQADTITLTAGCTYTLSATLHIQADSGNLLIIIGNGATISGGNSVRVFDIDASANVVMSNLTITAGSSNSPGGAININGSLTLSFVTVSNSTSSNSGGGIYNNGVLTVSHSTISGNHGTSGGGIFITSNSTTAVEYSAITGNQATSFRGGGISNGWPAVLTLTNTTISSNSAATNGGGIYNNGSVTVNNSTIYSNSSGANGNNLYNDLDGDTALKNSILAGSLLVSQCFNAAGGTLTYTYTLIQDGSCGILNGVGGNRTGSPGLGALTGNPAYHPLQNGSFAINAGSNALVPAGVTTDQVGNVRIQAGIVDLGAYESSINPTNTPTRTPSYTPPAPDLNLITNGTFSSGLSGWSFSGSTQQISNGALLIAPTSPGGGFTQNINFNSAGEIFEVNFSASNSSAAAKTLNIIVRDGDWNPQYNCVFALAANAPLQNFRMRFDTSAGFIPMMLQGALSGNSSLGVRIDDITMARKTGISVPSTECTVAPPPNTNLVYDGAFNQGTVNWAAFNAAMQVVNIGGANGNIMELARWQGTPNGGFYQFNPYSAPANGVLQFTFQIGNQSNQSRVINMLVRNPDWTDMHSCFITVPANTPLTSQTILLKTGSAAWSNIVIQGWIQVGDYTGTPPLPFRFDNLNVQYLPSSGFGGSTQCPGPIPMPQHATLTPSLTATMTSSPTATNTETATVTPTLTATLEATATPSATASETATLELPTATTEPPTITPMPTDTATDVPTLTPEPPSATPEAPTATPEPPTLTPTEIPSNTPEPPPEVTQDP